MRPSCVLKKFVSDDKDDRPFPRNAQRVDLERLAARVARLVPSHRDPEVFHIEKSEIVGELRRLARAGGR